MEEVFTDCRTREGRNIGLMDSIIFICRVLADESLDSEGEKSALRDLRNDSDVKQILGLLDCGDHGCKYAVNKAGIRTKGGCRCKK